MNIICLMIGHKFTAARFRKAKHGGISTYNSLRFFSSSNLEEYCFRCKKWIGVKK